MQMNSHFVNQMNKQTNSDLAIHTDIRACTYIHLSYINECLELASVVNTTVIHNVTSLFYSNNGLHSTRLLVTAILIL